MRYNLESTLPIHAFQPFGGRHNPFKQRMTLEGGGGGFVSAITDPISSALGTDGGDGGLLGALADVDDFVGDTIPGGWGTVAAIAVPYAAPYLAGAALTAGQAAALAAGTSAATSAIRGDKIEDILKNAALSGATSYGLSSLGADTGYVPDEASPYIDSISPDSYRPNYVPDEGSPYIDSTSSPSYDVPPESFEQPPPLDEFTDAVPRSPELSTLLADPIEITGVADPLLGVNPTNNYYTDMTPGTRFEGPNGMEIVGPNGKTYLEKDLLQALSNTGLGENVVDNSFDNFTQSMSDKAATSSTSVLDELNLNPQNKLEPEEVFKTLSDIPYDSGVFNPAEYTDDIEFFKYNDRLTPEQVVSNDAFAQKQANMSMMDRVAELPGATYDMAKSYISANPYTSAAIGLGALTVGDKLLGSKPQDQPQSAPEKDSRYTGGYGSSGRSFDPYLLRNRVNAQNIYDYRNPRYAEGGEVKRFGLGGLSNAITRFTQPIEKAVIRPIGNAVPFLRDVAPYAGLIAAPFIASPFAAAGVGALASGFGTPGSGFNMKRAMMGGMAAYGMSNIGAGIEAAGTSSMGSGTGFTSGAVDAALSTPDAATGFFRNPDAMATGIKNLTGGSTYGPAAAQFATKAGIPSAGMTIMGTSGVMAVDEGIKQQALADAATAATQGENQEFLNRIAAGKRRAQQAVRENPYQYAMGGSVDDESGMDEARGLMQGNLQNGLFNYAAGGQPRFLSGGGDGMSDSIKATIEDNQEARLADGEFIIPADVVSHLGNGSSKAGAKQLYSMMDRVRQARVGNKKQGREIKPKKFMPA